eukprot:gene4220-4522_t
MEWMHMAKDRFPLSNGTQVDAFQSAYDGISNLLTAATWNAAEETFAETPADLLRADVHGTSTGSHIDVSLQKAGVFLGSDASRKRQRPSVPSAPSTKKEREVEVVGFGKKGGGAAAVLPLPLAMGTSLANR